MSWQRATAAVIVAVFLFVVCYDVLVFLRGGVEATISRVVLSWAHEYPVLPFSSGVLCGHLFWPQPKPVGPMREKNEQR